MYNKMTDGIIKLDVKNLSEDEINEKIFDVTEGNTNCKLHIHNIEHDSLIGIIFPDNIISLDIGGDFKTLEGVILPSKLKIFKFWSTNVKVRNVKFPTSLLELNASACLMTDISWLSSVPRVRKVNLSANNISNIDNITLPSTLTELNLMNNALNRISNVTFPATLQILHVNVYVVISNCVFNSIVNFPHLNKVNYDQSVLDNMEKYQLIFLYLSATLAINNNIRNKILKLI